MSEKVKINENVYLRVFMVGIIVLLFFSIWKIHTLGNTVVALKKSVTSKSTPKIIANESTITLIREVVIDEKFGGEDALGRKESKTVTKEFGIPSVNPMPSGDPN